MVALITLFDESHAPSLRGSQLRHCALDRTLTYIIFFDHCQETRPQIPFTQMPSQLKMFVSKFLQASVVITNYIMPRLRINDLQVHNDTLY